MKDLVELFFENYEDDINRYNNSKPWPMPSDNYPELKNAIKAYLSNKDVESLARSFIEICGRDFFDTYHYFKMDMPKDKEGAIQFLAKHISEIAPEAITTIKDLIDGKPIKVLRYVLIDDFKKINFTRLGECWSDYRFKEKFWFEEHIMDEANDDDYMEFIAIVPAEACSISESFIFDMIYQGYEFEIKVKDQSKIKLLSIRLKNNSEYVS